MAIVTGTALESSKYLRVNFDGYVSSKYWQCIFRRKTSVQNAVAGIMPCDYI